MDELLERAEELLWKTAGERAIEEYERTKESYSPMLRRAGELLNFFPSSSGIPNAPSPLAATLTSGLVGAGLGYGVGALGEKLMPATWEKGRLRKALAIMGGMGGAGLGGAWMAANKIDGRGFNDNTLLNTPPPVNNPPTPGLQKYHQAPLQNFMDQTPPDVAGPANPLSKMSEYANDTGVFSAPPVNVNEFNQVLWGDQRVAGRLDIPLRAAATGLMQSAAHLNNSPWVSPLDVARLTAGMGSGYLSGMVVGKVLGNLMGMPEETQDKLKNVGLWAGVIRAVVPMAFGE